MSTYVMGDIHGIYYAFNNMLRNIKFSENDTLYIIGDVVDRGPEPIKTLQRVMKTPNIKMLLGNHEDMMQKYYEELDEYDKYLWYNNGGMVTQQQFERLSADEKCAILEHIRALPLKEEITIGKQKYILAHASPFGTTKDELIWERIYPYQMTPPGDEIYICGHTPVIRYSRRKSHIAEIKKSADERTWFIDCGCAYGDDKRARLACVRLEDGKVFYCHTYPRKHYERKEIYENY